MFVLQVCMPVQKGPKRANTQGGACSRLRGETPLKRVPVYTHKLLLLKLGWSFPLSLGPSLHIGRTTCGSKNGLVENPLVDLGYCLGASPDKTNNKLLSCSMTRANGFGRFCKVVRSPNVTAILLLVALRLQYMLLISNMHQNYSNVTLLL